MDGFFTFVLGVLLGIAMVVVVSMPVSFIVMLILGALHATYAVVPAMSFWLVLITVIGLRLIFISSFSDED